ncbi:MAG: serine hydrolase family protein [Candidatus Taylorbacteria bacterium]|nr:serine hydrolase family protein [Candidatus Taylorbacteria bacterium]
MQKRVFLIHGWEGTPDNHWFPWLSWELKARGFEVHSLTMPHADNPKVSEWLAEMKSVIERPNKDTFIVGHSLGCVAIVRYIEQLPKTARVGGCVFVAGFLSELNISEISEFTSTSLDVEKAKMHGAKFVNIFSDNDEYVSIVKSLEFQKAFGAKGVLERGRGHFTKREGVDALPSVFKALIDMSS